ncbi:hypothetical protein [Kineococcus sp. SYSU DK003]|uniref:hypothetical protein n=1 Tax=Kineococcus sp. SYSU DK003 TaxID=3383124 RepID=UPI003D7DC92B
MDGARWNDGEPEPVPFGLGPWSGQVRRGGSLSDLEFCGVPVLRAVRAVLRDRDWRTAPATVATVDRAAGGIRLTGEFLDEGGEDTVHADWTLQVSATDDALTVDLTATTRTAFARNRFGLVVLHRPDEAGTALQVTHPDGSTTATRFPVQIAPHQPARDVAALTWSRPGVDVHVAFDGDVFEMEDQRNWTDASFKTYSTPLDVPFPVHLPAGATVRQRLVVRCATNATPAPVAPEPGPVTLVASGEPLPQWATTAPVEGFQGPLLVELVLPDPDWETELARARAAGRSLDVRLVTDDPAQLGPAVQALAGTPLVRLGVHSLTTHVSTPELWTALRAAAPPDVPLVAGARSHFTELNRTVAQLPADADGVVFASTPQMHDTGRDQVLEALAVQRLTARQAVATAAGRPVHVGPVTLRARFNAVATTPWRPGRDRVARDPRVDAPAFAAWVVASAAEFSVAGVASVTFGDVGGTAPDSLRRLARFAGLERLHLGSALPQGVHVLAGRDAEQVRVLVANLAPTTRALELDGAELVVEPGAVVEHVRRR